MWAMATRHLRLDIDLSQIPGGLIKAVPFVPECGWLAKIHLTLEWSGELRTIETEVGCDEAGRPIPEWAIQVLNQFTVFEDTTTDNSPPPQLTYQVHRTRKQLIKEPANLEADLVRHRNRLKTMTFQRDKALLMARAKEVEAAHTDLLEHIRREAQSRGKRREMREEMLNLEVAQDRLKNAILDLQFDQLIGIENPPKRKYARTHSWHVEFIAFEAQRFSGREIFEHPIEIEMGMYDLLNRAASKDEEGEAIEADPVSPPSEAEAAVTEANGVECTQATEPSEPRAMASSKARPLASRPAIAPIDKQSDNLSSYIFDLTDKLDERGLLSEPIRSRLAKIARKLLPIHADDQAFLALAEEALLSDANQ